MKPKTKPSVVGAKSPLQLTSQDVSFIRLAAAILDQPEKAIIESLSKKRAEIPGKKAA